MQVVILAGGLGTRLQPLTQSVPKPMVPIRGRPFLEYQVDLLRRSGLTRILLLVGYLADVIQRHFDDGRRWGMTITYSVETSPLGTAGALKCAERDLDDRFLLLNGDTYLPIDYADMAARCLTIQVTGLMAVYANPEGIVPNNVVRAPDGRIVRYDKTRSGELTHVDAGAYAFRKVVLDLIERDGPRSLEEHVFPRLARDGQLQAYPVSERYYDIGTFERLVLAERMLS